MDELGFGKEPVMVKLEIKGWERVRKRVMVHSGKTKLAS